MDADVLPWTVCVPSLMLIAQAVFLLKHEHTHKVADRPNHTLATAGVVNNYPYLPTVLCICICSKSKHLRTMCL